MSFARSIPISNPLRESMYRRSSVAIFPVAFGANGQPPMPPTLASSVLTPAVTAAWALATATERDGEGDLRANPGSVSQRRNLFPRGNRPVDCRAVIALSKAVASRLRRFIRDGTHEFRYCSFPSVTAPSDALLTLRAYFARTPRRV